MAYTITEIPLTPFSQTLQVALNNINYQLAITWRGTIANPTGGTWVMDISDSQGNALVQGIPLVTGYDLLAPYGYLGIGGGDIILFVASDGDPSAEPTISNLGVTSHLYLGVPA